MMMGYGCFEAWLSGLVSGVVLVLALLRWCELDKSSKKEEENDTPPSVRAAQEAVK